MDNATSNEGLESLRDLIERIRAGDRQARDAILNEANERLAKMASRMLDQNFARLRQYGHAETGVVLNQTLLGLHRAFDDVELDSPEHFLNLAALKMRRALLDLARKLDRQFGTAATSGSGTARDSPPSRIDIDHIADALAADDDQNCYALEVLEELERLPAEERMVIDLVTYGGRTFGEAALVLQVSEKTVRRRFDRAFTLLASEDQREP